MTLLITLTVALSVKETPMTVKRGRLSRRHTVSNSVTIILSVKDLGFVLILIRRTRLRRNPHTAKIGQKKLMGHPRHRALVTLEGVTSV